MKLLFNILLFLIVNHAFAQYKIELFHFDYLQINACNSEQIDPFRIKPCITNYTLNSDSLNVEIIVSFSCCPKINGNIEHKADSIFLNATSENNYDCDFCLCAYKLRYKLKGVNNDSLKIIFRGKQLFFSNEIYNLYPVKFDVYNSDTINYYDKYGLKQGLHLKKENSILIEHVMYKDNRPINGHRILKFHENGNKKYELKFIDGIEYIIKYSENGGEISNEINDLRQ